MNLQALGADVRLLPCMRSMSMDERHARQHRPSSILWNAQAPTGGTDCARLQSGWPPVALSSTDWDGQTSRTAGWRSTRFWPQSRWGHFSKFQNVFDSAQFVQSRYINLYPFTKMPKRRCPPHSDIQRMRTYIWGSGQARVRQRHAFLMVRVSLELDLCLSLLIWVHGPPPLSILCLCPLHLWFRPCAFCP